MAKLRWNEHDVSTNGRYDITPVTQVVSGDTDWYLSVGPLDQAPPPCATLEEAKELAQAIENGPEKFAEFEGRRTVEREQRRAAVLTERRRAGVDALLADDEFVAALRDRLAEGA